VIRSPFFYDIQILQGSIDQLDNLIAGLMAPQCLSQFTQQMPHLHQVSFHLFSLDSIAEILWLGLQVRFMVPVPFRLFWAWQNADTFLKHRQHQPQSAHQGYIAQQLGTIHPLLARFQLEHLQLGIGDRIEGLLIQINVRFLGILTHSTAKVVQGSQYWHFLVRQSWQTC
jgi:hypothetical protein